MQSMKFAVPDYTACEFVNLVSKWPQALDRGRPKGLVSPLKQWGIVRRRVDVKVKLFKRTNNLEAMRL